MWRLMTRGPVVVLLLSALIAQLDSQGAYADFFSLNHNTMYTSTWSYAAPLTLSSPPYFLHIIAESDLTNGVGSLICRAGDGTPFYQLALNPTEYYMAAVFTAPGGSYVLYQNYVTPGDSYGFSSTYTKVVDIDGDGNPGPKYDYELDFTDIARGRSVTMTYNYGLAYPSPSCGSDPWQTFTTIQSRTFAAEVDL